MSLCIPEYISWIVGVLSLIVAIFSLKSFRDLTKPDPNDPHKNYGNDIAGIPLVFLILSSAIFISSVISGFRVKYLCDQNSILRAFIEQILIYMAPFLLIAIFFYFFDK